MKKLCVCLALLLFAVMAISVFFHYKMLRSISFAILDVMIIAFFIAILTVVPRTLVCAKCGHKQPKSGTLIKRDYRGAKLWQCPACNKINPAHVTYFCGSDDVKPSA